jgi:hypothetical protein
MISGGIIGRLEGRRGKGHKHEYANKSPARAK